jgi:hypothetical protein
MHVRVNSGERLLGVLAAFALLFGMSGGIASAAPAAAGNKAFSGYSHDIKVRVLSSGAVTSGPVVAAGIGCSDRATLFFQDQGAGVSLGGVSLGTVTTSSFGLKSGAVQETRSVFQATGVSIPLGAGSLTADALTITSSTFYDTGAGTFTTSSSMTAANLLIKLTPLGPTIVSLNGTVPPNFGVTVPGIAEVVLHGSQTVGSPSFGAVGQASEALKIQLLGGLVSTNVGEVFSSLYGEADQTYMFGEGQGLSVRALDEAVRVGPLVTAQLPCTGNGGLTSNVLGVGGLPGTIGTVGAVKSTATGTRSGLVSDATTTSEVAGINLLGGVITADVIKSTSHVSSTNGAQTVSKAGSGSVLTNLVIAGNPISVNTPPNTFINLPAGLGYVIVNQQTVFTAGIEVVPLAVHVNAINADVVIARSYAFLFGPDTSGAALRQGKQFLDRQQTDAQKLATGQQALTDGTLEKFGLAPKLKKLAPSPTPKVRQTPKR